MAKLNLSNVDTTGREAWTPIPEGVYDLEVVSTEDTVSKNDKPQLKVTCRIIGGPGSIDRMTTLWMSLTEAAQWRLAQLFEAVGFDLADDVDTDELGGLIFRATCKLGEFNGKPKNEWDNFTVSPMSGAPEAPAPAVAAPVAAKPTTGNGVNEVRRRRPVASA